MNLKDAIALATLHKFTVWQDEHGWWVTIPKRPKKSAEDHGTFRDQNRAWFAAAAMAMDLEKERK